MRWVTRTSCHVDRTACAWLIRRFIDPDAAFEFVTDVSRLPADATPFDIAGQQFSHHEGNSTFEVMVEHFSITEPGIAELGRVIHEADLEDERYDAPEAAGLDAIIRGLGQLYDDARLIESSRPIYDALLVRLASPGPA